MLFFVAMGRPCSVAFCRSHATKSERNTDAHIWAAKILISTTSDGYSMPDRRTQLDNRGKIRAIFILMKDGG